MNLGESGRVDGVLQYIRPGIGPPSSLGMGAPEFLESPETAEQILDRMRLCCPRRSRESRRAAGESLTASQCWLRPTVPKAEQTRGLRRPTHKIETELPSP